MAERYEIRLHRQAASSYRRLQGPLRDRINKAIDSLAREPRPVGSVKLAGLDEFRIRIGDYGIVYAIDEVNRVVLIARIAHRREVYRH